MTGDEINSEIEWIAKERTAVHELARIARTIDALAEVGRQLQGFADALGEDADRRVDRIQKLAGR